MPSHVSSAAERAGGRFHREGEYWTIAYAGQLIRLKDTKGLRYLAHLVQHPRREVPVVELRAIAARAAVQGRDMGAGAEAGANGDAERARKAITNRIRQSVARIATVHAVLGLHLANAIHTGTRCVYTPERPVRWST